jgi:hypothetical protein
MADDVFRIKRGDRFPALERQAIARRTGEPVDLASAPFPRFLMRASGAATAILSATVGATVLNASQGILAYIPQAGDTATAGVYQGEFQVLFPAGFQTFPTSGYIPITIELDIG